MTHPVQARGTLPRSRCIWLVLPLCLLAILARTADAPPAEEPVELVSSFSFPADTTLARFLEQLGEHLDIDSRILLAQWSQTLDAGARADREFLARLRETSGGVIDVRETAQGLSVNVDRVRLRRQERELRDRVGALMTRWFPDEARRVQAQFTALIHREAGKPGTIATAPLPPDAVVLIHGLDDPGGLWRDLIPALQHAGFVPIELSYPNDDAIARSAKQVAARFGRLREAGVQRIKIVAHSMGGLVSREILTHPALYNGRGDGWAEGPAITHLVMVGTPNHGSEMARLRLVSEARDQLTRALSGDGLLFGAVLDGAGQAGLDLLPGSVFLQTLNARPLPANVRMTIIAGKASPVDASSLEGLAAILPRESAPMVARLQQAFGDLAAGVGDGCVTLASARLDGVEDFRVVDGNHISMVQRPLPGSPLPPAIPEIVDALQHP